MNILRIYSALAAVVVLTACTMMSEVRLYDGPSRDSSQIAALFVDPHVVVTRVDDISEHPTDKSRALAHSAGKRREFITLAPGPHKLSAKFFVLCLKSEGEFPLEFNVEPGKKYRLKSVVDPALKRWKPEIVTYDGEPIEDDFPWMKAMCPVTVNIVWLHR